MNEQVNEYFKVGLNDEAKPESMEEFIPRPFIDYLEPTRKFSMFPLPYGVFLELIHKSEHSTHPYQQRNVPK
jgi:hypothetical protein